MRELYSIIYLTKFLKLNLVVCFVLCLFTMSARSQSLVNTFSYGIENLGQIPIFPCEGNLRLNIAYNIQTNDTIVLYFPNSFHATEMPAGYTVADSLDGFVTLNFPISASGEININFQLKNCINDLSASGADVNMDNLFLVHI